MKIYWPPTALTHSQPKSAQISITTLHSIEGELTECLLALHALTGCDTTSKISTKLTSLNAIRKLKHSFLILNCDCLQLTESAIHMQKHSWSIFSNHQQTCKLVLPCVSLHLTAIPSRWTPKKNLLNFNWPWEVIINSSFGVQAPFRDDTLMQSRMVYKKRQSISP